MIKFFLIVTFLFKLSFTVFASPIIQARSSILVDYHSDEILNEQDADSQIYPA